MMVGMVGAPPLRSTAPFIAVVALVVGVMVTLTSAAGPAGAGEPDADLVERARAHVTNRLTSGSAAYTIELGDPDHAAATGDWSGDGNAGFASRRANVFSLFNELGHYQGTAAYGKASDQIFIGDWDGDGVDTFGVRRANIFFLRNRPDTGVADVVFAYGRQGDRVYVGDFDGDGVDTFAVRRGNLFFVRSSPTTGVADVVFAYGTADDEVLVGDWNGDGVDSFGVRREKMLLLRNDFVTGVAETTLAFGRATDEILVGDFDGDRIDTFAARRVELVPSLGPFAVTGPLTLVRPSEFIELIGFHESAHDGARQLDVLATDLAIMTMETRFRGTGSRSAADVAVEPGTAIYSPVSGTVAAAGTYELYCQYSDDFVWIEPDERPGWHVKVLHIDGVQVGEGDRVEAGITALAPRATQFPFDSQIDEFTAEPSRPHVHIEVVDLSIPDKGPPITCASGEPTQQL